MWSVHASLPPAVGRVASQTRAAPSAWRTQLQPVCNTGENLLCQSATWTWQLLLHHNKTSTDGCAMNLNLFICKMNIIESMVRNVVMITGMVMRVLIIKASTWRALPMCQGRSPILMCFVSCSYLLLAQQTHYRNTVMIQIYRGGNGHPGADV